jgi:hypothetical protein
VSQQPATRGRDTSGPLTEVRTVYNRARTAIKYLEATTSNDPDLPEMIDALNKVVELTARWRRTGR